MVFMLAIGAGASVPVGRADTTHDQLDVVDWDGGGDDSWVGAVDGNPQATVATVKVGLLASARGLQHDLDDLTRRANTASARGLAEVASEVAVALGRHPDYWTHAAVEAVEQPLSTAEGVHVWRALDALAAVSTEDMHALEVLWAPQEEGDTLSEEEMLADHPELMRVG
ncbi:hypothetical protein I4F81_003814 [Pyropia yezoensis]|uniref:Uncharacterized protein n=1 Tax=Pyropia yezoensis TaxID=2788 RepID=A0ACC3BU02_PYRYE|nr:hypothetical protein I4F81_003814 [Neopyropia yezoensis]